MRLIDADALLKEGWVLHKMVGTTLHEMPLNYQGIPTVDAVEIVRCKDCKYSKPFNEVWTLPKRNTIVCRLFRNEEVDYDFYCADGERKENETD